MSQITDIEFDHTDAETSRFADRCGCPKCERYRATPPAGAIVAPTTHAPISPPAIVAAARASVAEQIAGPRAASAIAEGNALVDAARRQAIPVVYCTCPLGTRPNVPRGTLCTACGLTRRERTHSPAPVQAPQTEGRRVVEGQLGISTDLRNPTGGEIVSPRAQVLADVQARLDAGRAPTRQDLQKWSTLLRSTSIETAADPTGYVKHTELVAGARANASGIFLGFAGAGNLERSQIAQVLAAADLPAEWLPSAKSAHAQAGRVVGDLSGNGYVVRAARVPTGTKAKTATERGWRARWTVGAGNMSANVGEAFGRTVLTVTLTATDALVIEGEEHLAARVRADFDTACRTDLYPVSSVSDWLRATLTGRFRAARVGGNWYVRRKYAADAERLCTELAKLWGTAWLLPAIPMATCDELCRGLVDNFAREADAVLATYRAELADAKTHGESEIGTRRATTLLGEVRALAERAVGYTAMFGERLTMELRERLCAAADEIAGSIDDITQRFSLIFDELLRDAKRDGWETL